MLPFTIIDQLADKKREVKYINNTFNSILTPSIVILTPLACFNFQAETNPLLLFHQIN